MSTGTPTVFEKKSPFRDGYGYLGEVLYTVAVVTSFALFVTMAKSYLRAPLHIPGHSAVYVVPLILLGRTASRNRLGGTGIGGISGVMMAFFGIGGGFLLGIPRYLFMGAVIDLLLWNGQVDQGAVKIVAVAGLANFAKFFVGLVMASMIGIPAFFIQLGITYAVVTHLTFGAIGGLLAFAVTRLYGRLQNQRTTG